jgi:hypothetical protein
LRKAPRAERLGQDLGHRLHAFRSHDLELGFAMFHKAIAEPAKEGWTKAILTTNFDKANEGRKPSPPLHPERTAPSACVVDLPREH